MSSYIDVQQQLQELSRKKGFHLSLDQVKKAHKLLGSPSSTYRCVQIAGSSGKGSVSRYIYHLLQQKGCKVGLYTSPHVLSVRERFEINGQIISRDDFVRLYQQVSAIKECSLTFFETLTLMALIWFKDQGVDFAVLEVGLGGRLDATSVVDPEVAVITSIQLEHTSILGSTIEEIAIEKGGIIKPGSSVVIGASVPEKVISNICQQKNAAYCQVGFESDVKQELESIALKTCELLGFADLSKKDLDAFQLPFRMQIFSQWPSFFGSYNGNKPSLVILDGAHHADQLMNLSHQLDQVCPYENRFICFTLMEPKDLNRCLAAVSRIAPKAFYYQIEHMRSYSTQEVLQAASRHSFKEFNADKSLGAFYSAIQSESVVVLAGSYYLFRYFYPDQVQAQELNVNEQGFLERT